jgi:hypothetical protein
VNETWDSFKLENWSLVNLKLDSSEVETNLQLNSIPYLFNTSFGSKHGKLDQKVCLL